MKRLTCSVFLFMVFILYSCGSQPPPIDRLNSSLKKIPTYSIILEDMKEEGFVSASYYHKYRVVTPDDAYVTPWLKVSEKYYRLNSGFLGMALVDKKRRQASGTAFSPRLSVCGRFQIRRVEN